MGEWEKWRNKKIEKKGNGRMGEWENGEIRK